MIPFLCIIAGSLITVVAAFFDYRQKLSDKQDQLDTEIKRSTEYQNVIRKSNQIITTQQTVIDTSKKIIELQNSLSDANHKIVDLQNSTINQLTGGESKPFINIFINSINGPVDFIISNHHKYTIHSCSFEIMDMYSNIQTIIDQKEENHSMSFTSKDKIIDPNKHILLGEIPPSLKNTCYRGTFPTNAIFLSYVFNLRWLNGFFTGSFNLKKDNGTYSLTLQNAWEKPDHPLKSSEYFAVTIY